MSQQMRSSEKKQKSAHTNFPGNATSQHCRSFPVQSFLCPSASSSPFPWGWRKQAILSEAAVRTSSGPKGSTGMRVWSPQMSSHFPMSLGLERLPLLWPVSPPPAGSPQLPAHLRLDTYPPSMALCNQRPFLPAAMSQVQGPVTAIAPTDPCSSSCLVLRTL